MPLKHLMFALFTAVLLTTVGCAKEEGTMEKVGKSLDEAADSAEDAAEEAADKIKEATE